MRLRRVSAIVLAVLLPAGCSGTGQPAAPPAAKATTPAVVKPAAAPQPKDEPPAQATPDALVGQAVKAYRSDDLDRAIRLLDQALAADPTHRQALFVLAAWAQERASELDRPASSPFFLKSAQAIRKLHAKYTDLNSPERELLGPILYNEACTYAIQNQPEKALDALAASINAGFAVAERLAEDDELASIRSLPRFAELTKTVEKSALEQAESNARKLLAGTRPFPFRFELPDVSGKKVTLDDIPGKIVIVDLWGTWCKACCEQLPHFKALLAKYRDRGVAMVGINYELDSDLDPKARIKAFTKEHNLPYPCLIGDERTLDQVPEPRGYPTTLFLDRSGTVRVRVNGYHSLADLDAIVTLLLQQEEKVLIP